MTNIIDRLLDEAEKAQRKGHLLLAEVCRDASDQLGLVMEERDRLLESVKLLDSLWHEYHDAFVLKLEESDRLRAAILDTEPHDAGLVPMRLRLLALKENDQ